MIETLFRRAAHTLRPPLFLAASVIVACSLAACSPEQTLMKPRVAPAVAIETYSDILTERAMQYFVSGGLYDAKEQHSQAILEYQDALKYAPGEPAIFFAIAKSYKALDKSESAIFYAKKAVDLDSINIWYTELLGQVYYETRSYDAAAAQFIRLAERQPTNIAWFVTLAEIYIAADRPDDAIKVYDRITYTISPELEIFYRKLLLQSQLKRYEDCVLTLQEMILLDPENPELYRTLGDTYTKLNKPKEAAAAYSELLTRNPDDVKALIATSETFIKQKDWAAFSESIDKIFKSAKLSFDEKMGIGDFYAKRMESDSLMTKPVDIIFTKLSRENPKAWRPFFIVGILRRTELKWDEAYQNFRKAVDLEPKLPEVWETYALTYLQNNDAAGSVEIFREAKRKLEKPDFRIAAWISVALSEAGKIEESITAGEAALKMVSEENDTPLKLQLLSVQGINYDRTKKPVESENAYEEVLKIDPKNALALNNLAYSLSERDLQLERCLTMAKVAVEKEPKNSSYLDTIGWVYYKLEKYDDAKLWIEKAIENDTRNSATLREHLGDIYLKLGDRQKAQEFWREAIKRDEKNVSLQQKLNTYK
ncbi:MAG: tetratricopeptide repeat protein [Rhizobacter sp.]|nr:tetratricopeptide repeat protein [Chlorobiales bacterium]